MFRQALLLLAGLLGAAILSQAPAFTNQYAQNLAGRLDGLNEAVTEVERSLAANLAVETPLAALRARRDRLEAHRRRLAEAGPFLRLAELARGYDREVADSALFEFEPGLPLTIEGAGHAAAGFVAGRAVFWLLLSGLGLFRRRARAAA